MSECACTFVVLIHLKANTINPIYTPTELWSSFRQIIVCFVSNICLFPPNHSALSSISLCVFCASSGPVRAVCTSSWPKLRASRVWASPWIRVAVSSRAFPSWSTTTAHTDCLSLEQSTWPCSILCTGCTKHDRRIWDIDEHAQRGQAQSCAQNPCRQAEVGTLANACVLNNMLLWFLLCTALNEWLYTWYRHARITSF